MTLVPILPDCRRAEKRECRAFTLIETLFGMGIVSVLMVTLYAATATSLSIVQSCQENQRATQIITEKLDTIRLYNWTQITNRYVPTNFVVGIDPAVDNSRPYYTGTVVIAQSSPTTTYRSNLMQVTVNLNWVSQKRPQSKTMTTYMAKYGLQTYIMR
jgi:prepilin-type N-terminal cleavage/methylation domain-containing protein